jgi:hypothetical protein
MIQPTYSNDPIYSDNPQFGTLLKTYCPSRSDICGNLDTKGIIQNSSNTIPLCKAVDFSTELDNMRSGCCVVETPDKTCKDYLTNIENSTNSTGAEYDIGIDLYDGSGLNPRSICHSAPIRKRNVMMKDFFITILISAGYIILSAFIGSCYEFWFKYGHGEATAQGECFNFKRNCGNYNISPIDYAFPSRVNDYPYTECGADIDTNDTKYEIYTLLRKSNMKTVDGNKFSKVAFSIIKAFTLNFVYTLIFSRIAINYILKICSTTFRTKIITSPIMNNIVFLILSGIAFTIIANYTGNQQISSGVIFIIYILVLIVLVGMGFTLFATVFPSIGLYWNPKWWSSLNLLSGYELFNGVFELPDKLKLGDGDGWDQSWKFMVWLFGIFLYIILFILAAIALIFSFSTGFIGALMGAFYMIINILYYIFIFPLLHKKECFFSIIKDHSQLLIILFCISIVLSSVKHLNSTTSGVISGIVGIIILYKIIKNISSKNMR